MTICHHSHLLLSSFMSFNFRNRSAFVAAVRLIRLGDVISTGKLSTRRHYFSFSRLSASIISNGTRYFKGRFKVSILSELRWCTFISAPLISLSVPSNNINGSFFTPRHSQQIVLFHQHHISDNKLFTVFEFFVVIIFTFLYSCYILIFQTVDKVTLYVCNFAAKIFPNLVVGNFIPCIVFITFFIYMASVNQVVRCNKTFIMVVAHVRQWSRVNYTLFLLKSSRSRRRLNELSQLPSLKDFS